MQSLAVALISTALAGAPAPGGDFARLGPPGPDDWRVQFPESVQTFLAYRRSAGRALPFEKRRITLVPFGEEREGDGERLSTLLEVTGAYFMTRVELEPRRAVPADVPRRSMRGFGRQILADESLKVLSRRLPTSSTEVTEVGRSLGGGRPGWTAARLALASDDRYAASPSGGPHQIVFGLGSAALRAAICSYARLSWRYRGEPLDVTPRKRLLKLATHELAHVFGLAHCRKFRCQMNGSNSLRESDLSPMHLCPECLRKLSFHLGFDRALRYRTLEKLYRKLGWKAEADFAARRAIVEAGAALRGPAPAEAAREGENKRKSEGKCKGKSKSKGESK